MKPERPYPSMRRLYHEVRPSMELVRYPDNARPSLTSFGRFVMSGAQIKNALAFVVQNLDRIDRLAKSVKEEMDRYPLDPVIVEKVQEISTIVKETNSLEDNYNKSVPVVDYREVDKLEDALSLMKDNGLHITPAYQELRKLCDDWRNELHYPNYELQNCFPCGVA